MQRSASSRMGAGCPYLLSSVALAFTCRCVSRRRIQPVPLSARNHMKGEITEVLLGTVTALITVKVGDNLVESVITKRSAEEMGLKKGDKVIAVIKATEVMIQKG